MSILTCMTCGHQTPAPQLARAGATNCHCPRCQGTTRHLIGQPRQVFDMELDQPRKRKKA